MDRIFQDAVDKNVAAVVIYADANKDLFYDEAGTTAVPAADCLNLFAKGVVCKYSGTYYKPVSCTEAGVISFGLPA